MRRFARGQRLRRRSAHRFRPGRNRILARLARERADVRSEFPDLVLCKLAAPGRHAVWTTLGDARSDLVDPAAVAPLIVHQRGPDRAAAMGVAADAVHLAEQELAFGDCRSVVVISCGARIERKRLASAGEDRVRAFARRNGFADRLGPAVALLAIARREREPGEPEDEQTSAAA